MCAVFYVLWHGESSLLLCQIGFCAASNRKIECHECGMIPFSIFDIVCYIFDSTNLVYYSSLPILGFGGVGLTG